MSAPKLSDLSAVEVFDLHYIIDRGEVEFLGPCKTYESLERMGLVEFSEAWGPKGRRTVTATDAGRALVKP